jgi:hypothetical protein
LKWSQTADALLVELPPGRPGKYACALKITVRGAALE